MIDNLIAAKFRRPLKVLGTSTFNIPTFFKIQIEIEFHFCVLQVFPSEVRSLRMNLKHLGGCGTGQG